MEEMETTAAPTNEGESTTETEQAGSTDQSTEATETVASENQEATEEAAKEGAPEQYESFKAPEGSEFDADFVKAYSDVAKELNLSQKDAQKLLDKVSPVVRERQEAQINAVRDGWAEAAKTDKEFGGDKLSANLAVAKTALDKFGTPELKGLMNQTGLGNHPELIRFFYRAGKAISEDTFVGGHKEGSGDRPKNFNDFAEKLYS